ncbi:hypothetical protein LGH70_11545 [Hymenobacter sp. BT635]|uniref:MerC domain-containing protein n=1 Tax=Hymenobacter nitidus TaxID=2880929 RepID=A0ABS8AER9_9BACT|nr:hypothetical protein [Hymenobacter nitidus]MCB2378222.1 hypothetical protein [Hymenobacter nitidus]
MRIQSVVITNDCGCGCVQPAAPTANAIAGTRVRALAKSVPAALVSIGIAFFPKCPLCWAAYMSVLGSIGIVRLPAYQPWMLPVLVVLLLVHLYLLCQQLAARRYWPFTCSLLGAFCLLLARSVFPLQPWLALVGIGALAAGSLLNNFSFPAVSAPKSTFQPLV